MEPPDVQFVGICHGHTQKITCMVLDPSSGQASCSQQQHPSDSKTDSNR